MADDPATSLILAYAQKYAETGNSVVTLMCATTFAVIVAVATKKETRYLLAGYAWEAFLFSAVGNALLTWLLIALSKSEVQLATSFALGTSEKLLSTIEDALRYRVGALWGNAVMYYFIVAAIRLCTSPTKYAVFVKYKKERIAKFKARAAAWFNAKPKGKPHA